MRKRTLGDFFLALTIGGFMAVLSPSQDSCTDTPPDFALAATAQLTTGDAEPAEAGLCADASSPVDLPHPAKIAGEAASHLEMPFFSFGSAHLE